MLVLDTYGWPLIDHWFAHTVCQDRRVPLRKSTVKFSRKCAKCSRTLYVCVSVCDGSAGRMNSQESRPHFHRSVGRAGRRRWTRTHTYTQHTQHTHTHTERERENSGRTLPDHRTMEYSQKNFLDLQKLTGHRGRRIIDQEPKKNQSYCHEWHKL